MEEKLYTTKQITQYSNGQIVTSLIPVEYKKKEVQQNAYVDEYKKQLAVNYPNKNSIWDFNSNYLTSDACARQFKNLIYSCICFRGENVAKSVPFMYKKINQSEREEIDRHNFLDYLDNPNEIDTFYEMLFETLKDMDLYGNAYWEIVRDRGKIRFYLLPPYKERWSFNYTTGEYVLKVGSNKIKFAYNQILHFRHPSANRETVFGTSLIEAGRDIFEMENYINSYQTNFFKNDAMLKFYLSTSKDFNDGNFKRFYDQYIANPNVENAGEIPVFPSGIEPKIISVNPKEADYVQTWKLIQTRTLSLTRISPSLLGIVEDVNRANAVSAYRDFLNFILDSIIKKIDSRLTKLVKDEYGTEYFIKSKIDLPIDKDFELRKFEAACRWGVITVNEARQSIDNYDSIKGGDKLVNSKPEEFIPPVEPDPNNPQE